MCALHHQFARVWATAAPSTGTKAGNMAHLAEEPADLLDSAADLDSLLAHASPVSAGGSQAPAGYPA